MIEQYNNQVLAFSKSFADAAFKLQGLALQNFEKIADIQLKTFENRANATAAFVSEALEVRDFEGLKAIWPKGVTLEMTTPGSPVGTCRCRRSAGVSGCTDMPIAVSVSFGPPRGWRCW